MNQYVTSREFAERMGVQYETFRKYHKASTKRRDAGVPARPGDIPAPQHILGRLAWTESTVAKFLDSRPGRHPRTTSSSERST